MNEKSSREKPFDLGIQLLGLAPTKTQDKYTKMHLQEYNLKGDSGLNYDMPILYVATGIQVLDKYLVVWENAYDLLHDKSH